ncbi:hypothetical protein PE066_14460 [Ramlibacter tataouinensis]|uniref:hypothetical protein n=1 Tax=Ramlibacter tataouinensis TaxID=94132 RepID=UPI0022F3D9EF|nr:hypothetical protein [Ramlibacter tataouinensis]WBY00662.1 hypothetical protein PE066_14460 [Ramlibacter tataouinensis]
MPHFARPLVAGNWRPWLLRVILVAGLAACGGGGDGGTGIGEVAGGGDAVAGGGTAGGGTGGTASGGGTTGNGGAMGGGGDVAVAQYRVFQLTPYDDGSCHTCVNAAGQMAVTASHAGRFATFFDGNTNTSRLLDFSPFRWSFATALNEAGQVAGGIQMDDGRTHAARWTPAAGSGPIPPLDLGAPEGGSSAGAAINEAGQVAGTQSAVGGIGSSSPQRAFLWTEGSGRMELGEPPAPFTQTSALRLNEAAQVAGSMRTDGPQPITHAFFWSAAAGLRDLGTFGGPNAIAKDLNDDGQVAGQAEFAPDPSQEGLTHHAFLWSEQGGLRDLGTLGGRQSSAEALNNAGQVVGQSDIALGSEPRPHAFLWSGGTMRDLGTLGGPSSIATAINDSGQVVGRSALAGTDRTHAFIWTADRGMVDLNTRVSGVELLTAFAISRTGAILAMSSDAFLVLLLPAAGS